MKKILLTLACVFGMSMTASAYQNSKVMLQHNGNITSYEPEQIDEAIEAAASGDAIFLTEGDFPGFTIDKRISVRGTGVQTVIKGDIIIETPDVTTISDIYIANMDVDTYVKVNSPVNGLKISQCSISKLEFSAKTDNAYIDRCSIGYNYIGKTYKETVTINGESNEYTYSYLKGLTVTNSNIGYISGTTNAYPNVTFINCYIGPQPYDSFDLRGTTIINSILNPSNTRGYLYKSVLINTAYNKERVTFYDDCQLTGCYDVAITTSDSEYLETNGYFGNDGTIIGPLGGNTPYTLIPTVPHVTEASLKVDPKKQELNATLTVSPN